MKILAAIALLCVSVTAIGAGVAVISVMNAPDIVEDTMYEPPPTDVPTSVPVVLIVTPTPLGNYCYSDDYYPCVTEDDWEIGWCQFWNDNKSIWTHEMRRQHGEYINCGRMLPTLPPAKRSVSVSSGRSRAVRQQAQSVFQQATAVSRQVSEGNKPKEAIFPLATAVSQQATAVSQLPDDEEETASNIYRATANPDPTRVPASNVRSHNTWVDGTTCYIDTDGNSRDLPDVEDEDLGRPKSFRNSLGIGYKILPPTRTEDCSNFADESIYDENGQKVG